MALIAYWNGAYSGTASNLAYCAKGAFGTFAVKNSLAFSELTNKPTTLSGYGITNALSTSGGTINGELTINTPSGYGIMLNGGMITSEDDGLYIYPSASSGEPYVTIGGGCQVDIDGWTYAPAFVCGNTSNDAQLYMYINGKRYMFNTTALLKSGLLENI